MGRALCVGRGLTVGLMNGDVYNPVADHVYQDYVDIWLRSKCSAYGAERGLNGERRFNLGRRADDGAVSGPFMAHSGSPGAYVSVRTVGTRRDAAALPSSPWLNCGRTSMQFRDYWVGVTDVATRRRLNRCNRSAFQPRVGFLLFIINGEILNTAGFE